MPRAEVKGQSVEVTLVNRSVYSLPSKQRVGCIVYDGSADMQLWPGPGPDSLLSEQYGDGLQRALDTELKQVPGRLLEIPSVIRVTPGRLHCNFLAWLATRASEPGSKRQPAPDAELLTQGVVKAIEFAAERNVTRMAFGALGGGPGELSKPERLVLIVKAAHAYHERCFATGTAPVVEEVLVCDGSGPDFRKAKERVRGLAKASSPEAAKPKKAKKRRATKKASGTGKTRAAPRLTADEIATAKTGAEKYSMKLTYAEGDYFIHPKFGVGKVIGFPAPGQILVGFEDGSERKMVHARG